MGLRQQSLRIHAGSLRHHFYVQQRTVTRGDGGSFALSWSTIMTLNGSIATLGDPSGHNSPEGREYQYAETTTSDVMYNIVTRAQVTRITPEMRIVFGSRVFNIISVVPTDEIRHILNIFVRETTNVTAESATVNAQEKSYSWGEIDFTSTQSLAISVDTGMRFFPNKVEAIVSTLGGNVTVQPTIKVGIGSNHTKYLSSRLFTVLTALWNRQSYDMLLADAGETDLWLEISVGGAVDAGTYRGSIVVFGDQIG